MLRRLIIIPNVAFAAVSVKKNDPQAPKPIENQHFVCKASELPVYQPLHAIKPPKKHEEPCDSELYQQLESAIRAIRVEMQKTFGAVSEHFSVVEGYWETAKAHTQGTIDYLNQPQNTLPRGGAIAIGGLAGFIFAARGGFLKKVFFTSVGAGSVAALCYPRKAEEVAHETLYEARKLYAITYNFVKGVKPGDEIPLEPINKFPTSLEDIRYMIYDLYDEAKDAIFSKKN